MKDILTVMKFTINDMIKRKSFIISTLVIVLLIIIGFNVPNIIKLFNNNNNEKTKLLIVDKDNIFENNLNYLENSKYEIIIENITLKDAKNKLLNHDVDEALYIKKIIAGIEIKYLVENIFLSEGLPEDIYNMLDSMYTSIQISKLNISEDEKLALNPIFIPTIEQVGEEVNGNVFAMMILSILLFYAIYFCAYQVSSSITIEKTSKIIETLVTSTTPKTIVLGKTIGIGLVGLMQMVLYVLVAIICANYFIDKVLLNAIFDLSSITIGLFIITFIYFILGYLAFSLLYALTGSTVSKPEDIQNANGPVAIISVASFYLAYFTMLNPTSSLNKFASLFPLSSPFSMPFRIMMGLTTFKDILLSISILIITILLIAKIAIKIYSNAILNYGTKLGIKDIIGLLKQK